MTRPGLSGILISAALGSAVGLIAMVGAAIGTVLWARRAASGVPGALRGSGWRMAAAAAGVSAGIVLDPPSWPAFAVSFLMVYLSGNGILMLRLGRSASRG
jgi:hypothetical protein